MKKLLIILLCLPMIGLGQSQGCTNYLACNYNSLATIDDGSCVYPTTSTSNETACDSYDWNGTTYTTSGTFSISSSPSIGDIYQGGVVFYVDGIGGGLLADLSDLGNYEWGCYSSSITGADGTAIGTGQQNTLDILNGCSQSAIAAEMCDDLTSGGYSDWYLPSADELNQMYLNRSIIEVSSDLFSYAYWSSSESNDTLYAYFQNFDTGNQNTVIKQTELNIRAVRSFSTINVNLNGCDSIATLNLAINYSNTGTSSVTACDTYTWNGTTYTQSGSYSQTFTNLLGCDSVHTLVVTIGNANTGTSAQFSCDSFEWNGQIITSSGSYNQTFTNLSGCDSAHTLVATISYSNTGNSSVTVCDSYDWDGVIYAFDGIYTNIYINSSGCDSLHTLTLTISPPSTLFDAISICNGETYVVNNSVYTNSGNYIDSIINSNGCLSIIYTNLTVSNPLSVTIAQVVGSVLESTVSGGIMPYDYLWNNFATTPNITISSNGSYWLVVTDSLSCPNDTAFYGVTNFQTSISELGVDALSIYPNPSSDLFNIEFTSYVKQSLVVRLVNVIGEYILEDKLADFEGDYKRTINLSPYSKGIYFLEIETYDGIINKKLILQ
jgi:hypothetical protein